MKESIEPLISKFLTNDANREELLRLEAWIQDKDNKALFLKYIKVNVAINKIMGKYDKEGAEKMILRHIKQEKSWFQNKNKAYFLLKYVAVVVITFGLGYFYQQKSLKNQTQINTPVIVNTAIQPGTDKATLTLGDGSQIALEKGSSFQVQNADSNGEELIYEAGKRKPKEVAYHYLTIPRGGEYFIKLSDGTRVWLNSESQLKYPIEFIEGETREVELVYGEAYFDVSPSSQNKGSKFIVNTQMQEIQVVGTEFNIKAYLNEDIIYTTLVEGKVLVNNDDKNVVLNPGKQSKINTLIKDGNIIIVEVDVESEISWKKGMFSFKNKSLKEIMKVLSRWYDIDVVFSNKELENIHFKGVLKKNQNIEEILLTIKNIQSINAYEINDKKVTIK